MRNTQSKEDTHGIIEVLPVAAVELAEREEDESKGDVLEEVSLAADCCLEGVNTVDAGLERTALLDWSGSRGRQEG